MSKPLTWLTALFTDDSLPAKSITKNVSPLSSHISIPEFVRVEWYSLITPGIANMLMSYSSWFDKISNAFLYPIYPDLSVPSKLKPYKLVPWVYWVSSNWLSAPVNLTVHGAIPSVPPWKGIENLSWFDVGPLAPVTSIEALNEPDHALEL